MPNDAIDWAVPEEPTNQVQVPSNDDIDWAMPEEPVAPVAQPKPAELTRPHQLEGFDPFKPEQFISTPAELQKYQAKQRSEAFESEMSDTVAKIKNLRMTPIDYFSSEETTKVNNYTSDYLASRGYQLKMDAQGNKVAVDSEGTEHTIDSKFVDDLQEASGEIATATAAAWAGAKVGARKGPWGALFGAVAAGATGAAAGKTLDMTREVFDLDLKMQGQKWAEQAGTAAALDAAGTVITGAAIKYGSAGIGKLKRAWDLTIGGNKDGAAKALMQDFGLSTRETEELVAQWEGLTGQSAGESFAERAIKVIPGTQAGGEGIAKSATAIDPAASAAIRKEINTRAEDLMAQTAKLDSGKLLNNIRNDVDEYTGNIKEFYGGVRDVGQNIVKQTHGDITFSADDLGISELFQNISHTTGSNKVATAAEKHYADVVNNPDLTFSDLLDLRQGMNYFSRKQKDLRKADSQLLTNVIGQIDGKINEVMKNTPGGRQWQIEFDDAKNMYKEMSELKDNVLYKQLTRKNISEDDLTRFISKSIQAEDTTLYDVMEKLPPQVQKRVEGRVVNALADKYTDGMTGQGRATHFPKLAEELGKMDLKSPEAKQLKEVVDRMAQVFKNDPELSRVSGGVSFPKFQSYLTTDPVVRAKYEIASTIFNKLASIKGMTTKSTRANVDRISAVRNYAKLMENPMDAKSVRDLVQDLSKFSDDTPDMIRRDLNTMLSRVQTRAMEDVKKKVMEQTTATAQRRAGATTVEAMPTTQQALPAGKPEPYLLPKTPEGVPEGYVGNMMEQASARAKEAALKDDVTRQAFDTFKSNKNAQVEYMQLIGDWAKNVRDDKARKAYSTFRSSINKDTPYEAFVASYDTFLKSIGNSGADRAPPVSPAEFVQNWRNGGGKQSSVAKLDVATLDKNAVQQYIGARQGADHTALDKQLQSVRGDYSGPAIRGMVDTTGDLANLNVGGTYTTRDVTSIAKDRQTAELFASEEFQGLQGQKVFLEFVGFKNKPVNIGKGNKLGFEDVMTNKGTNSYIEDEAIIPSGRSFEVVAKRVKDGATYLKVKEK